MTADATRTTAAGSVNPSRGQVARFERETPDAKAIVMLNLLRFRDVAAARAV